ncbi:MAG: hypothetical protein WBA10_07725 [Elainellaceae cyanobacterium]
MNGTRVRRYDSASDARGIGGSGADAELNRLVEEELQLRGELHERLRQFRPHKSLDLNQTRLEAIKEAIASRAPGLAAGLTEDDFDKAVLKLEALEEIAHSQPLKTDSAGGRAMRRAMMARPSNGNC